MKSITSFLAVMIAVCMIALTPSAFALSSNAQIQIANTGDPCQNPNVAKSSVALSTAGSATTGLVTASTGKYIYVCSIVVSMPSTTDTFSLVSNTTTTTACDTGSPTTIMGATVPTASTALVVQNLGTFVTGTASKALCSVQTGTTHGTITYVQQ